MAIGVQNREDVGPRVLVLSHIYIPEAGNHEADSLSACFSRVVWA